MIGHALFDRRYEATHGISRLRSLFQLLQAGYR
jgi:hypothetical protein